MFHYLCEQNDMNTFFLFICAPHILSLQQLPDNFQQKHSKKRLQNTADSELSGFFLHMDTHKSISSLPNYFYS